jgi:hypothetical protein
MMFGFQKASKQQCPIYVMGRRVGEIVEVYFRVMYCFVSTSSWGMFLCYGCP